MFLFWLAISTAFAKDIYMGKIQPICNKITSQQRIGDCKSWKFFVHRKEKIEDSTFNILLNQGQTEIALPFLEVVSIFETILDLRYDASNQEHCGYGADGDYYGPSERRSDGILLKPVFDEDLVLHLGIDVINDFDTQLTIEGKGVCVFDVAAGLAVSYILEIDGVEKRFDSQIKLTTIPEMEQFLNLLDKSILYMFGVSGFSPTIIKAQGKIESWHTIHRDGSETLSWFDGYDYIEKGKFKSLKYLEKRQNQIDKIKIQEEESEKSRIKTEIEAIRNMTLEEQLQHFSDDGFQKKVLFFQRQVNEILDEANNASVLSWEQSCEQLERWANFNTDHTKTIVVECFGSAKYTYPLYYEKMLSFIEKKNHAKINLTKALDLPLGTNYKNYIKNDDLKYLDFYGKEIGYCQHCSLYLEVPILTNEEVVEITYKLKQIDNQKKKQTDEAIIKAQNKAKIIQTGIYVSMVVSLGLMLWIAPQ